MPQRFSFIFQATTAPLDANSAIPHTAGWTETHWRSASVSINDPKIFALADMRALMLPKQAAILGWKQQTFTIDKNKVVGGGVQTYKRRSAGNPAYNVNIPQDAMQFSASVGAGPNAVRFTTRCLPDEVVAQGEFSGDVAFKTKMTNYGNKLVSDQWAALVRDLTRPSSRVLGIAAGLITVSDIGNFGASAGNYVILRKVKDSNTGKPISGSFLITNVNSTTGVLTVMGMDPAAVSTGGGFCRLDFIEVENYTSVQFARVVARKVGSPFEKYRGRRSKRRA